jgi:large subunit ribosomal protein L4
MAAPKAPLLDAAGAKKKDVTLEAAVFAAEVKPHLVHEAVRAELNSHRAGTFATKSRGLVSGGRVKPWRQKGTGRARQGTIRAPQFEGGGHAFAKVPRTFVQKVNRKAAKAALRSALAGHVQAGSLALVDASVFDEPSTKTARGFLETAGLATPIVLVLNDDEVDAAKSFRNLPRVAIVAPSELEVSAVVWARSLVVSQAALPLVQTRAGGEARDNGAAETVEAEDAAEGETTQAAEITGEAESTTEAESATEAEEES